MTSKQVKRPLLSAQQKVEAIKRVQEGESKASVARDIGVPESTLRGWCKNVPKLMYQSRQSTPETAENEPIFKKSKYDDLIKCEGAINNDRKDLALQLSEHNRNRAELSRISAELGLNRSELGQLNIGNNNLSKSVKTDAGSNHQTNLSTTLPANIPTNLPNIPLNLQNFMALAHAANNAALTNDQENKNGTNVPTTRSSQIPRMLLQQADAFNMNGVNLQEATSKMWGQIAASALNINTIRPPGQQINLPHLNGMNGNQSAEVKDVKLNEPLLMLLKAQQEALIQSAQQASLTQDKENSWLWQWHKQCGTNYRDSMFIPGHGINQIQASQTNQDEQANHMTATDLILAQQLMKTDAKSAPSTTDDFLKLFKIMQENNTINKNGMNGVDPTKVPQLPHIPSIPINEMKSLYNLSTLDGTNNNFLTMTKPEPKVTNNVKSHSGASYNYERRSPLDGPENARCREENHEQDDALNLSSSKGTKPIAEERSDERNGLERISPRNGYDTYRSPYSPNPSEDNYNNKNISQYQSQQNREVRSSPSDDRYKPVFQDNHPSFPYHPSQNQSTYPVPPSYENQYNNNTATVNDRNYQSEYEDEDMENADFRGRAAVDSLIAVRTDDDDDSGNSRLVESPLTPEHALVIGEKFLKWLENCSNPNITLTQISQLAGILNNVRKHVDRLNNVASPKENVRVNRRKR